MCSRTITLMPGSLARTRDTVATETPAVAAISAWRGRFGLISLIEQLLCKLRKFARERYSIAKMNHLRSLAPESARKTLEDAKGMQKEDHHADQSTFISDGFGRRCNRPRIRRGKHHACLRRRRTT